MPANQPGNHQPSTNREVRNLVNNDSGENSVSSSVADRASPPGNANPAENGTDRAQTSFYEFIDSRELARRWDVPVSWIRDQVRRRAEDPLPHVNLGKYVRFLWDSPELHAWIERRIVKGNNRRVGRVH